VDATRIDAVMNLVGELIIGKSMLNRTLTEFDQKHARDPLRAKLADAMAFQARILDELHKCVLKIRMVPVEQLFRRFRASSAMLPSSAAKTSHWNFLARIPISIKAFLIPLASR